MVDCPVCKNHLPMFRAAENARQMFFGGWTCKHCGSEIDRKGNIITRKESDKEREDRLFKEEYIKEKARLQAQKEMEKK